MEAEAPNLPVLPGINTGDSAPSATPKRISLSGKILIGLTGGFAIGASIVCYSFVAPAFRKYCLPYVPATTTQVQNVLTALRLPLTAPHRGNAALAAGNRAAGGAALRRPADELLLDIGSGDGRIVVAAARHLGCRAHGVELNPWLVQYSRLSALANGVSARTAFYRRDLWTYDLSPYRNIVIFGVEQMMEELERKLHREASGSNTSRVIVCRFPLPNASAHTTIGGGVDTVWVYDLSQQQPLSQRSTPPGS